jgi:hypothetical protein
MLHWEKLLPSCSFPGTEHALDRLMGAFARSTKRRAPTNVQCARATGRFWRGFILKEPVDSKHSCRIPMFRLKNRRTFTLFTTFATAESLPITASNGSLPTDLLPHLKPGGTSPGN